MHLLSICEEFSEHLQSVCYEDYYEEEVPKCVHRRKALPSETPTTLLSK